MIPTSLSASSILVSQHCLARWRVENLNKSPRMSSAPADTGTSVHFALEDFVKAVYLDKKTTWDDVGFLKKSYDIGYIQTFGNADFDTDEYADGAALVAKWYDRNKDGLPNQVVSCEIKSNFEVRTSIGPIPFNYIWDRCDQVSETVYEVVDYKTIRKMLRPEDLKRMVQPRAYALAAQIQFPHATRIWVTFDLLRHDPVGVVFTKEENAATYRYLQRAAERIIVTDEEDAEETLNPECNYCLRKSICETLLNANSNGSILGLSLEELAEKRMQVQSQMKALEYLDQELDSLLMKEAEDKDVLEYEAGPWKIEMTASSRRKATNPMAITRLVGPELTAKYGNWTVTNVDKMLKSGELSEEVAAEVRRYIPVTWGEPKSKVTPKDPFEETNV